VLAYEKFENTHSGKKNPFVFIIEIGGKLPTPAEAEE
jgi:hypothetical protein